ncbi:MAG: hypothetical protein HamCj_00860 [Candidatus Hamiltonella defensa (Ceratovacuna japonica)]
MMMSTHRIQRQIWAVQLPSHPPSWAIQNTLSQLTRTQLWPRLALLCDKLTHPDRLYCIERLELDIGVIELTQWESSLMEKVAEAFAHALEEQLQRVQLDSDQSDRPAVIEWDKTAQARRTLDAFIKTGRRPWWAHQDEKTGLTLCLSQLMDHAPQALRKMLREYLKQPACLQRLITHCADRQLWALSQLLVPAEDKDLARGCQRLQTTLRRAFSTAHFHVLTLRPAYWQAILLTCAERHQNILDKEIFFKQVLLHLATHAQLHARYLWVHLLTVLTPREQSGVPWRFLLPKRPTPTRYLWAQQDNETVSAQLLAQLETLRHYCLNDPLRPGLSLLDGAGRPIVSAPRLREHIERLIATLSAQGQSGGTRSEKGLRNALSSFDRTLNKLGAHRDLHATTRSTEPCQTRFTSKKQAILSTNIVPDVAGETPRDALLTAFMAMITTLAVMLKKQQHRAQHARGKPFLPPQWTHESPLERGEETDIDNAGLILLGPFLKPFFTHTRLLQDDHFLDREAALRAVLLLQYLITPHSTFFESALPLNKLLCGLDVHESIEDLTFTVSLLEQSQCQALFEKIAGQWPVMARMSPHYLIQHFLLRRGVIRDNGHHWRLQVERTTHDVLMTGICWPMRHLDLPWFNKPIQVEW